ncbi:hypothetical protein V8953_09065 [Klebsiella michiganensis]|uniref:hypothetical protein n=1 Tax=Klebsiella michiganensis TaxID=1134687 RepID=UPI0030CD645F
MTKSTITREENIQAVFDLKAGYTLGLADVEILKRVARIALGAIDSEPVGYFGRFDPDDEDLIDQCSKNVKGAFPLYRHAQQPVVPESVSSAIEGLKQRLVDCNRYNYCSEAVKRVENACAAMLNGGKS